MGVWNAIECWFLPRLFSGIRSFVGILALPFRPLYSSMSLLSFLHFLRDSHFNCPRMPVTLPVWRLLLPITNLAKSAWQINIFEVEVPCNIAERGLLKHASESWWVLLWCVKKKIVDVLSCVSFEKSCQWDISLVRHCRNHHPLTYQVPKCC